VNYRSKKIAIKALTKLKEQMPEKPSPPIKGSAIGKKYARDGYNAAMNEVTTLIDKLMEGLE